MSKAVFVFPGQGSQHVGMGAHLASRSEKAAELFRRADEILGLPLSRMCFEGPEEELRQTDVTQPALFVTSAAALEVLREAGLEPAAVAGHSLGEYSALYAAGSFDFETGLKLVATRGVAFADAGRSRPGAMAAIVGLAYDKVQELCDKVAAETGGTLVPANQNEPMQTVISGDPDSVELACGRFRDAGAKRALQLPVSGAFHSPLVAAAAEKMLEALNEAEIAKPAVPFVNNVDARVLHDPEAIKGSLVRQVTGSVRWTDSVQLLLREGHDTFVEAGSGKALSGLVRRINREAVCHTMESEATLEKTLQALAGK